MPSQGLDPLHAVQFRPVPYQRVTAAPIPTSGKPMALTASRKVTNQNRINRTEPGCRESPNMRKCWTSPEVPKPARPRSTVRVGAGNLSNCRQKFQRTPKRWTSLLTSGRDLVFPTRTFKALPRAERLSGSRVFSNRRVASLLEQQRSRPPRHPPTAKPKPRASERLCSHVNGST